MSTPLCCLFIDRHKCLLHKDLGVLRPVPSGGFRVDGTPFLSPLIHTYKVLIGKGPQKNKKIKLNLYQSVSRVL